MHRTFATPFLALALLLSTAAAAQPAATVTQPATTATKPAATTSQPAASAPATVPNTVKQAFAQKFPTAANPAWTATADHNFQAAFTLDKAAATATFDAAGTWRETKTAIPLSAISPGTLQAIRNQMQGYNITATYSRQRPDPDGLTYQAVLDNGTEIVTAECSPEGSILDLTTISKTKP
jgi:hypothetical protein